MACPQLLQDILARVGIPLYAILVFLWYIIKHTIFILPKYDICCFNKIYFCVNRLYIYFSNVDTVYGGQVGRPNDVLCVMISLFYFLVFRSGLLRVHLIPSHSQQVINNLTH